MSTPNNADRNDGYSAESPAPASSDAERERVERRIEELREQGIISGSRDPSKIDDTEPPDLVKRIVKLEAQGVVSGSRGPRSSLWNMPQLPPDALKRFLEREYRDFPSGEQQ
jgi:hypothetical protein